MSARLRAVTVPSLVALACLSKAVAVAAPFLLLAHDLLVRRRPPRGVLAAAFAAAFVVAALHGWVGHVVGMVATPLGGSRAAAFVSMGPVWWDYLARSFVPTGLSVVHDVPVRAAGDMVGWLANANLIALFAVGWLRWRAGDRRPLVFLAWFLVPLAPTAQFLVPLQNAVADRYLLLAVLGPAAALGVLFARLARTRRGWPAPAAAAVLIAGFGMATLGRAAAFHDSVALFRDATARTAVSATAPYQLGKALQEDGDAAGAERAFRAAFARREPPDVRCAAVNNLAVLLGEQRRIDEGVVLLQPAVLLCPGNPRTLNNLAEFLARAGRAAESRRLYDDLVRRFPGYEVGRCNWARRYGPPLPRDGRRPGPCDRRLHAHPPRDMLDAMRGREADGPARMADTP